MLSYCSTLVVRSLISLTWISQESRGDEMTAKLTAWSVRILRSHTGIPTTRKNSGHRLAARHCIEPSSGDNPHTRGIHGGDDRVAEAAGAVLIEAQALGGGRSA
ncbi:hypothetical protein KCU88_g66, partial [Aureobasidium melanogenum]